MRYKYLLVIFTLCFCLLTGRSYAVSPTISPTPEVKEINYQLPYPGILPDHPLYPLKVIRDKIYDLVLSDPVKKTEFKLLMADKRFFMGYLLFNQGKNKLCEQTVSKGSKYYEEAVLSFFKAEKEGRDLRTLRQKLIDASLKYQELLTGFQTNADNDIRSGLQGSQERVLKYQQEITSHIEILQDNK